MISSTVEKRLTARTLSGSFSIAKTLTCETVSNNQGKLGAAMLDTLSTEQGFPLWPCLFRIMRRRIRRARTAGDFIRKDFVPMNVMCEQAEMFERPSFTTPQK